MVTKRMDGQLIMYDSRSRDVLKMDEVAAVDAGVSKPDLAMGSTMRSRCCEVVVDWANRRQAKGDLQTQTLKCGFADLALFVCPLPATAKTTILQSVSFPRQNYYFAVACSECCVSPGVMQLSSPRLTSPCACSGSRR